MRSRRSWKQHESLVAASLQGTRNPLTGIPNCDVDAGPFAVEVKTRERFPKWLTHAVQQAKDAAGTTRTGIVVLVESRQGVKARRYVLLTLEDWQQWHGTGEAK